jgi:hypothetical protein
MQRRQLDAAKTVEEYLLAFPIQMEEVDKITDCPTFKSCNRIIKALKTNCISIEDEQSDLDKLHCIIDTENMEDDAIAIAASINPGPLSFDNLADTQAAKDSYFFDHVDQGARVTRVTRPTARYRVTRKILKKIIKN